jgi:hypothetical protein
MADESGAGVGRARRFTWRRLLLTRQINTTVRPELVEGRWQGFDKLSPNGI